MGHVIGVAGVAEEKTLHDIRAYPRRQRAPEKLLASDKFPRSSLARRGTAELKADAMVSLAAHGWLHCEG